MTTSTSQQLQTQFGQTLNLGFWDQQDKTANSGKENNNKKYQNLNHNNNNKTTFLGCDSIEINLVNQTSLNLIKGKHFRY